MDTFLYIVVGVCGALAIALALYIFLTVRRNSYISAIYASSIRDCRFVYALLKMFFPNDVIRSPHLLKNPEGVSPKADTVAVLKGGILIITVLDQMGYYRTPVEGEWSVATESGTTKLPNALKVSKAYENAISEVLIKAGIPAQPIYSVALLSDDKARYDELYPDGILTGDKLIPFCKNLNKTPVMTGKNQKQIIQALSKHHKSCKTYNEKNFYNIPQTVPLDNDAKKHSSTDGMIDEGQVKDTPVNHDAVKIGGNGVKNENPTLDIPENVYISFGKSEKPKTPDEVKIPPSNDNT